MTTAAERLASYLEAIDTFVQEVQYDEKHRIFQIMLNARQGLDFDAPNVADTWYFCYNQMTQRLVNFPDKDKA